MTGTMTTSGGNFEGPGTVTLATSATWEVPASGSTAVSGGSLVNDGTATIDAIATLSIYSGATVTNNGTMTMYAFSGIYGSNTNTVLDNAGTLVVNPGLDGDGHPRRRLPGSQLDRLDPALLGHLGHLLGGDAQLERRVVGERPRAHSKTRARSGSTALRAWRAPSWCKAWLPGQER